MKSGMFYRLHLLFLLCFIVPIASMVSSCGHCSGCDYIYETQGAAFDIPDSSIALSDPFAIAEVRVERIISQQKGTRHCRYKNEVSCLEDGLDSNLLEIYCTNDLALREGFVAAGTNLLKQEFVLRRDNMNNVAVPAIFLQASDTFQAGRYTFIVKGTTKEGKRVEDIAFVTWYR